MSATTKYIKTHIINDIEELADDVSVLFDIHNDGGATPKDQIDKLISLAKKNKIDFWTVVKSNCSSYEKERLEYIYEGKDLDELDKKTFVEKETTSNEEFFPERDGQILISIQQAIMLHKKVGHNSTAKHYYIVNKDNLEPITALLSTSKQKEFMQLKDKEDKYIFYAAIPKNDLKN